MIQDKPVENKSDPSLKKKLNSNSYTLNQVTANLGLLPCG